MGETILFRANRARREVAGLVLPFGVHSNGHSEGSDRFRFVGPDAVSLPPHGVPLLVGHDMGHAVGFSTELEIRADGVYGVFLVDDTPEGDAALDDVEAGKLAGFSAGMGDLEADCACTAATRSCACDATGSTVVEVSLVSSPAFAAARFSVKMPDAHHEGARASTVHGDTTTRKKAGAMSDEKPNEGAENKTPDTSGIAKFSEEVDAKFSALAEKLAESQEAQSEATSKIISDAFAAAFNRMSDVDTTGRGEVAAARAKVISEPPIYRFNGDRVGHSLVRDAWASQVDRDPDAMDRQRRFMQQQRDMISLAQVADVNFAIGTGAGGTTDASSVIPPGYRPDLFVAELNKGRPIVAQTSRGTITDATPFTVPVFTSATGASADHAEGVNPTPGTLSLTETTVAPGAISGSFELTREIVDSSNPAIDAIALAAMRESYNRQTEQKVNAALQAATPGASVSVGTAVLNNGFGNLIDTIRADLLAVYPFVRFADPTGAVIAQNVVQNFARAKDTAGRPLLPSVGAANANGMGNAINQGWDIDGLAFRPAWAMTGADTTKIALILNSADVWSWESPLLTFRFEEKKGPAIIELALFGYFATHVLRPAGIFAVTRSGA